MDLTYQNQFGIMASARKNIRKKKNCYMELEKAIVQSHSSHVDRITAIANFLILYAFLVMI